MDAMQEFRVFSNSYAAEYGHSAGGVIALSTRSGTNELHGSVFEFLRNNALDARNFFAAIESAAAHASVWSGSLGGPIRKDKTHFFTTWEQTRQLTSFTPHSDSAGCARSGRVTSPRLTRCLRKIRFRSSIRRRPSGRDRQPFPGNRIPENRFDPVARAVAAY